MASEDGDPVDSGQPLPTDDALPERLQTEWSPSERSPTERISTERISAERISAQQISTETVRELYEVHSRDLLAFLIGVLRDGHAAEEVAQTTFRRLLEAGHEARAETIKGWLFKVGFHEAMAFRRRQALQGRTLKKYTAEKYSAGGDLPPANPTSHDELVRREDVAKLKELLAKLPPDQQHVVRQRMYEEKTFAVIAQELNVPLGTVLTRMRLAMEKLQKWWERPVG